MARSFTICRNITTTLTRADTVLTLNAFASAVLALLQDGGTYAMGADQVYVQWDNTAFNVVVEDSVMAAASGDLATFKANIRSALLSLEEITALSVDDISTLEQSSVAGATVTADGAALLGVLWSSGTQVPALTAAGVATVLAVGTGANAIPQRDGSGSMPSPYADDTWDYSWVAADGDPLTHGFANAGTRDMTTASTTYLGVPCWSLAASGLSGTSYVKVASGVAAEGPFELRAKIAMPASAGSTIRFPLGYNPNATEFGSKSLQLAITTAYLAFWSGSNIATVAQIGNQIGIWVDITIRGYHSTGANGFAEWIFQVWIGGVVLPIFDVSGGDATLGAAGDIFFGRLNAGTNAGTFYLAELKLKNGINAAPPSYTLRGNTWPL